MHARLRPCLSALCALAIAITCARARQDSPPADDAGPPASMARFSDEGVFDTYRAEERLVRTRFTWRPDGSYDTEISIGLGGQTMAIMSCCRRSRRRPPPASPARRRRPGPDRDLRRGPQPPGGARDPYRTLGLRLPLEPGALCDE